MLSFNHMIVWLPDFQLYADTTSGITPFGVLPPLEYGKPTVHVGRAQGALQHVPLLSAADSTYSSSTTLRLEQGQLSVTNTATATGALTSELRNLANQANTSGSQSIAQAVLHARNINTNAANYEFPETNDLSPQYSFTSSYQVGVVAPNDFTFALPEGLNVVDGYSPILLGPVADARFKTASAVPCFSGNMSDDFTLELPMGKRIVALPQDGRVETANLSYSSHWSQAGSTVSVHRELHAHFDKALCTGSVLRDTRDAMVRIHTDYETQVQITSARAS